MLKMKGKFKFNEFKDYLVALCPSVGIRFNA